MTGGMDFVLCCSIIHSALFEYDLYYQITSFHLYIPPSHICTLSISLNHNLLSTHLGFLFSTNAFNPSFIFSP
jgi:hypothetical protein